MKIDQSVLNNLPQEQRERFESHAAKIVYESFVLTADRDYLTARFAFFQKQSHLFWWSAAQAVEKYLKANILLLGKGSIDKTHGHTKLANDLTQSHPERLEFNLAIPEGWAEQGVAIWPCSRENEFIARLEKIGAPNVRYDQTALEVNLQDLVLLDRLAFGLRNQLIGESIRDCKLVGEQLKECFFDLNYAFAPSDYQHPPLAGIWLTQASVSALEAAINGCYGYASVYRKWATESLAISNKGIQQLVHKADPSS